MPSTEVERFASEGALISGGARAILLQLGDPVVAAGVARHSDFSRRPLDRLNSTLSFVYAVMLGTPEQRATVTAHVNRAHGPVEGAFDPRRQLWVAATLFDTADLVHRRIFGTGASDEVYAAYAPLATSLQVPADLWPATRADFDEYFAGATAALEIGDEARRVAGDLFRPAVAPLWLRAALPLAALLTASLLDDRLRTAYGMPWSAARRRRADAAWSVIRAVVRIAPAALRRWPARHYLARLRA